LLSSLKLAFKVLISQDQVPLKLCLFIDGLDEYDGDETEIAALFGEVSNSANVKCCVSSRPHLPFQDAFSGQPGLRLEDLTFSDIKRFVQDELADDNRMQRLLSIEPDEAAKLIEEIVTSANGVFLWVKLVVASLLKGLGNRDHIAHLHDRLRVLPKKLEDLYTHMISLVDDIYQEEASRLYQLVGSASNSRDDDWKPASPLSISSISFAEERDPNLALNAKMHFLKTEDVIRRCKETADRITSRCGGLLEVYGGRRRHHIPPTMKVSYLHRTVKDCLEKWETQTTLKNWTGGGGGRDAYQPNLAILKAYILQLKCIRVSNRHNYMEPGQCIDGVILYARRVEREISSANFELMDEFFGVAFHWIRRNHSSEKVFRPGSSPYTIAVQCGLHRYLQAKLAAGTANETINKMALLQRACSPIAGLERFATPELVHTLLESLLEESSADPDTILRMTMSNIKTANCLTQSGRPNSKLNEQLKPWADIVEKLLYKGVYIKTNDIADLRARFSSTPQLAQRIDSALQAREKKLKSARFREKHKCRQQ